MYNTVSETVEAYDELLNDLFEEVRIGNVMHAYSEMLNLTDPCAYKCGWIDWCDSEGIDTDELEDDFTFDWDR